MTALNQFPGQQFTSMVVTRGTWRQMAFELGQSLSSNLMTDYCMEFEKGGAAAASQDYFVNTGNGGTAGEAASTGGVLVLNSGATSGNFVTIYQIGTPCECLAPKTENFFVGSRMYFSQVDANCISTFGLGATSVSTTVQIGLIGSLSTSFISAQIGATNFISDRPLPAANTYIDIFGHWNGTRLRILSGNLRLGTVTANGTDMTDPTNMPTGASMRVAKCGTTTNSQKNMAMDKFFLAVGPGSQAEVA